MKNRILTLVMVLGMVGVLVGCSKLTKMNDGYYRCAIETKEEILKDTIDGEEVDLFTKSVDSFTFEEKEELDGLKALLETHDNSYEEFCDDFRDSCKENYNYIEHIDNGENIIPFFTQRNAKLVSNEEDLISIIFDISGYWGGAHPFSYYELLNYNPKTGNKILFEDVIDITVEGWEEKLTEVVYNVCEEKTVLDEPVSYFENYKNDLKTAFNDDWFYLTKNGIVFVYGEYGITPYSEGIQEVEIPFSSITELLKDSYKKVK